MRIYTRIPLEERFWDKVNKSGPFGCWIWTGVTTGDGYGQIYDNGKMFCAHRVAFELTNGIIPKRMCIDHICHNPACVNPTHLRLATVSDNNHNSIIPKTNTSGFKGVFWHTQYSKWQAQIRCNGKRIYLGRFDSPEDAYTAYCEAAKRLHGDFANFGGVA